MNLKLTISITLLAAAIISVGLYADGASSQTNTKPEVCITCHNQITPGLTADWNSSRHASAGVGCGDCHLAGDKKRSDVQEHYGSKIIVAVTPKDCSECHEKEAAEFLASHHARAAQFVGSLDNFLGEIVGGSQAADIGCRQCHGSILKVGDDGKLDPATWPNTGIGRVNLDGSSGSCSACHARHRFSVAQARQPEPCGKCHLGPDHPQLEIYEESKHGILYETNRETMNLDRPAGDWRPGRDYLYPTCAACHMGATSTQPVTHDVGKRISWTLRPVISTRLPEYKKRKESMLQVCQNCHSRGFATNFYSQYEDFVELYNDKFARPAQQIMDELKAEEFISPTPFDDKIEWTFFYLWHHEGRRARHGASMSGPDYAWWHGLFEVADRFYNEFLPEAEELKPGIADSVLESDYHRWRKGEGLEKEEIDKIIRFYRSRYQQ